MDIALTVIGCLCTALLALIAFMLRYFKASMEKGLDRAEKRIETNGRHLDSVLESTWKLTMRQINVEDFLEDSMGYRPLRIVGKAESGGS